MAAYQLTNKAESEIESIYEYSILNFGLRVAQDYISGLHNCFELLADNQSWGTDYGFIKSGLLRYESSFPFSLLSAYWGRHFDCACSWE